MNKNIAAQMEAKTDATAPKCQYCGGKVVGSFTFHGIGYCRSAKEVKQAAMWK